MTGHPTSEPAIVIERRVAAPIEVVWAMWTESEHFAAWYGPNGARIPVAEIDARVGGSRRVCMEMGTGDGAMQMWFGGTHREVEPVRRLVYTEAMCDADGNPLPPEATGMPPGAPTETTVTVELEAVDASSTHMVMTHAGVPADSPGATGWNMALDKLDALLDRAG